MFGIGFWEIVVIAVVALIFVRPADLPGLARKAGAIVSRLRKAYADLAETIRTPVEKNGNIPEVAEQEDKKNKDKEPS